MKHILPNTRWLCLFFSLSLLMLLPACTSFVEPGIDDLPGLPPLTEEDKELVIAAYKDVEELYDIAWNDSGKRTVTTLDRWAGEIRISNAGKLLIDTTLYTGYYDPMNDLGYLATLTYREPMGVSLWQLRLQTGRELFGNPGDPGAIETVRLTFLTYQDLSSFLTKLESNGVPYFLNGLDPAGSFSDADDWSTARLSSVEDGAVLTYNDTSRRAELVVRDPIITFNADGSATVRDGGPSGAVRTRYYWNDFVVGQDGVMTAGTLDRTLLSYGDYTLGDIISRTEYPDGSFRQTRQHGGSGVIVRTNTEG